MSNTVTFERIQKIFTTILKCDENVIQLHTNADEIDEWDSLSHIQLVLQIEKEFSIKFSLGELQDLKNIQGLVKLVESKVAYEH